MLNLHEDEVNLRYMTLEKPLKQCVSHAHCLFPMGLVISLGYAAWAATLYFMFDGSCRPGLHDLLLACFIIFLADSLFTSCNYFYVHRVYTSALSSIASVHDDDTGASANGISSPPSSNSSSYHSSSSNHNSSSSSPSSNYAYEPVSAVTIDGMEVPPIPALQDPFDQHATQVMDSICSFCLSATYMVCTNVAGILATIIGMVWAFQNATCTTNPPLRLHSRIFFVALIVYFIMRCLWCACYLRHPRYVCYVFDFESVRWSRAPIQASVFQRFRLGARYNTGSSRSR